jgi:hypothetical protein
MLGPDTLTALQRTYWYYMADYPRLWFNSTPGLFGSVEAENQV